MTPKNLRLTITNKEAIKKVSLVAAVEGKDPKDVMAEAIDFFWSARGGDVEKSVKEISPVAHLIEKEEEASHGFFDEGEKDEERA